MTRMTRRTLVGRVAAVLVFVLAVGGISALNIFIMSVRPDDFSTLLAFVMCTLLSTVIGYVARPLVWYPWYGFRAAWRDDERSQP